MLAVNRSTFKKNMASYCENIHKTNKPLLLKDGLDGSANLVVMTQNKYKEFKRRVNNAEFLAKIDRGLAHFAQGRWQEDDQVDDFYSERHMAELDRRIAKLKAGQWTEHELIELPDDDDDSEESGNAQALA